jgi:DNA-binding transcriptional LysR family regulator
MSTDRYQEVVAFVQIARSGSFSAAGRVLELSPSAISKLVTRLEKRFGARLFNRTTHAVRLSQEGEALLIQASRVVEAMKDADHLIDKFAAAPVGQLRVYGLPSFALSQLAPIIPEFLLLNPQIRLDIQLGIERIDSVEADVDVILRMGQPADSTLISRKIADSGWVVCAAPSYLSNRGVPQTPADLAIHNCLNLSLRTHAIVWSFNKPSLEKGSDRRSKACSETWEPSYLNRLQRLLPTDDPGILPGAKPSPWDSPMPTSNRSVSRP